MKCLGQCYMNPFRTQYPLASQVVHHPTVLAAYGEGRKWTFAGDAEVKSKFWGRSIELTPIGLLTLSFNDGDVYTWNKVCSFMLWFVGNSHSCITRNTSPDNSQIGDSVT